MVEHKENALKWCKAPFDIKTQREVKSLFDQPDQLEDAFHKNLKFGTGGMRGIMGVGTNRINKYTLGKATQGLSIYLKSKFSNNKIKAVIAYDCRHNNDIFSEIVSNILLANGIKVYLFSSLRTTPELSFSVKYLKANCGIVLTAGGIYMWHLLILTFIYFTFQYTMIISLEEERLRELFGKEYELFCQKVPRLFPRLTPWVNTDNRLPKSVQKTLKTEKRTLQNLLFILSCIFLKAYQGITF